MLVTLLLVSFCLLISFCLFESFFILKLISRLKTHRRYAMEFLSIQTQDGVSVEYYIKKQLLPGYISILIFLFIIGLVSSLVSMAILYKALILGSGILGAIWARVYNKTFLSLIWEKVLIP